MRTGIGGWGLRIGAGLSALLITAGALPAQVPPPESVLGYKPGADFHLASYEDSLGYFRKLAANSNRIKLVNVGKSTQGRDWWIAFISDPANLAQLEHYKDISRRLALARGISDEQAHQLAREMKPIVHIDGGLHATEVANHQHTIQLGYDLVASEEPEYKAIRQNLIVELWFSINPDGQTIVSDWYMKNVGTPYEVSPLPWLYQEYVGHDNNRDGYMLNMLESREITRATLETEPIVFYTQHQSAPFPGRIYLPPYADPISGNMHPLMVRWLSLIG
ncbi:MAG TPA: M14 family zinc carboxypeptidase, partial [Bryobacteraceae bacterium]|nr:M14 family zinc carboxypeptidase [Bryobacteraceae bacterium]